MLGKYGSLAGFLLLVLAAAAVAGLFEAGTWYHLELNRPAWALPPWSYAGAGAIAQACLALSAWLLWQTGHNERWRTLAWWLALPVAGILWSALLFGLHRPGWSWLLLSLAVGVAVMCLLAFRRISLQAALLLTPYVAWLAYLWCFNLAAWSLSGGILGRLFA